MNGGGLLGLEANTNAAKQQGNTEQTSHMGIVVAGTESVNLVSGKETNIIGSKVQGETVTANIGGNLNIESLQDTNHYVGESFSKGFSVSTNGISLGNISASSSRNTMNISISLSSLVIQSKALINLMSSSIKRKLKNIRNFHKNMLKKHLTNYI